MGLDAEVERLNKEYDSESQDFFVDQEALKQLTTVADTLEKAMHFVDLAKMNGVDDLVVTPKVYMQLLRGKIEYPFYFHYKDVRIICDGYQEKVEKDLSASAEQARFPNG